MRILTPEGIEKINRAKFNIHCKYRNFAEWCSNHLLLTVFAAMCWSITPFMFYFADLERGYDATGREVFTPFLPLIAWAIGKTIEDDKK